MLNLNEKIISPSEEPFALFFYKKYKNKTIWTENELLKFIDEFWLIAEKNLNLFFTSKENLFEILNPYKEHLNYETLCKLVYLQFIEPKPKQNVEFILDKQIKYFFYLKQLIKIFPDSKYVILTRDPRVNAIRKKNRKLNSGKNSLYLSALWNNTYKNISFLKKMNKQIHVVKYEDLVLNPKITLQKVCDFLTIAYSDDMLKTDGVFDAFLNMQKSKLSEKQISLISEFQSSLFKSINTDKVALKPEEIDNEEHDKIVELTKPLLKEFAYDYALKTNKTTTFSILDRLHILKAYLYRPLIIQFYLLIPLEIKLIIKKSKKLFFNPVSKGY